MPPKQVVPAVHLKSFSCPHCGALADQTWYTVYVDRTTDGEPPHIFDADDVERLRVAIQETRDPEQRAAMEKWIPDIERRTSGQSYIYREEKGTFTNSELVNIFVSLCFSCREIAIWRYDVLLYPPVRHEIEPNVDMNPDIRADFDEARAIFSGSPRAAAALLRLCVQKLCIQLELKGKRIDDDIASLVSRGLPVAIQQALDVVRVIGNNAVHPGAINLNDDRETASKLFELANLIAENQISQPKAIAKLFDEKLPPGAKEAIARRDAPKS